MNFTDQTKTIVIGATSGIGRAVVDILSQRPGQVIALGRSTGLDITDVKALETLFSSHQAIDHLVITAGSQAPGGSIDSLDLNAAKQAFDIKFWGTIAAVQIAAKHMRQGGSITLTSGFLARRAVRGTFTKTAMNAALEASAKVLALELAPLRINVVSPGLTNTEAYGAMAQEARDQMFDSAAKSLPVGRVAQPQDVAAGYVFAIDNPSVSGSVIDIDGGALIK